jgi:NAD(P)H-hydrate repair Nnr-like enzyme with NAD(P)H-hydrate dehydratase domain
VTFLEEEVAVLRRKLADSPRQVRALEERLAEAQQALAGATGQNDRLVSTLKEARDQIVALKEEVERARLASARDAALRSGAVVVLKGDDTLVVTPDGRVAVSEGGAPALATAGTGDVLAGIVGTFLAAGLEPWHAACAAVRAHLLAGRAAASPHGPDGVIATDVIAALPGAIAGARYAGRS